VSFDDSIESIAVGEGHLWVTTAPLGMNMPDDTVSTLHRIDPVTLEETADPIEVAEPGSQLEVAYGYVWVGDPNNKQIVQVDPYGPESPQPSASPDPEESQSLDRSQRCLTSIPFEPGQPGQAWTWGVGSAEQIGVPLNEQDGGAVVHFIDGEGRSIDVIAGPTESTGQGQGTSIEVLDRQGTLTEEGGARSLVFSHGGCTYQLLTDRLSDSEFRIFARTLTLRGQANSPNDAFAMWPVTKPEEAYSMCFLATDQTQEFLSEPQAVAATFALEELGFKDARVEGSSIDINSEADQHAVEVANGPSPSAVRVLVSVREVAADCWVVSSVSSPVGPGGPTSLSVTKRGARLIVGFDLAARGLDQSAATILMPVEDGDLSMTAEEFRSAGQRFRVGSPELAERPGGFLLLIKDRAGQVIGAIGQALPSGDFTAG
jgi:hypothetical protein